MFLITVIKKDSNRLFITALVLFVGGLLTRKIPVLSFIAFAPMFAMLDKPNGFRDSYRLLMAAPIVGFLVYFITQEISILDVTLYSIWGSILFLAYAEVHLIRQNILNKFALVVIMLGAEYVIVKFIPANHGVFIADLLLEKHEWTRWNMYTGYLGTSLWILLTNLIFYQAIFKSDTVKKWVLLTAILFILLPIIYSLNLSNPAISKTDMTLLYSGEGIESNYSGNGEFISRTGAWVSALILIFTFVKSKTKQKHK